MAGGKPRARRLRAIERDILHANCSSSHNTAPDRVTDSYRPGQGTSEDPFHLDDQPMWDVHEAENPRKRRKGAESDCYRPSVDTYERRRSPPPAYPRSPVPPKAKKPSKAERKEKKIWTLQNKIHHFQQQLSGVWLDSRLRMDTERDLASCQATLKTRYNLPARNNPEARYNTVRAGERTHAMKVLREAKAKEASLEYRLKIVRDALEKDVPVTVSDDQEEGGVSLTPHSTTDDLNLGRMRRPPKIENRRRRHVYRDELVVDPVYARRREKEVQEELENASQQSHIVEVDANYCCFAPLDQPYICLYPTDEWGRLLRGTSKEPKKGGRVEVDPEKELLKDTEAGILRTNLGHKPPLWTEIDEKMKAGLFQGLADTLGLGVDEHHLTEVGGKIDALERAMVGSTLKRRHSWLDDDEIAPEDLDSDSESQSHSDGDDDEDDEV